MGTHLGCEGVSNSHDCATSIHNAQVQGDCPHRHGHVDGNCLPCTGGTAGISVDSGYVGPAWRVLLDHSCLCNTTFRQAVSSLACSTLGPGHDAAECYLQRLVPISFSQSSVQHPEPCCAVPGLVTL